MDRLDALHTAMELVRRGGTVSLIGVYGGAADPLDLMTMFDKHIQVRMGQANVKRWVPDILPLLTDEDPLGVDSFATHVLPLDEAPQAYSMVQPHQSLLQALTCASSHRQLVRHAGRVGDGSRAAGGDVDAKTVARYVVHHGLPSVVIRRAARQGDLQALLISDPQVRDDPFPTYDAVRARGPLVRGRISFVSATHAVCHEVLRHPDFRAGTDLDALPPWLHRAVRWASDDRALGPIDPPSLLVVEPPDHTRYRRLVSKVFTARAIEALRPRVEQLASDLLDQLDAEQPIDLVAAYAELLPVMVIAEILGVPAEQQEDVLRWGRGGAPSLDIGLPPRTFRTVDRSIRQFNVWLGQHLDRLREHPGDDLLSRLVALDGEDRLTDVELRATAGLLLAAGFETTVNLLSNGTQLLVEHPEERALLREDPTLWPGAVEEVLRYESPVQVTARSALRETSVAGTDVRRGQMVVTMLGGANRDPDVFPDPHRFDVTRENARDHLAFSGGIHYCLGAALARLEGEVGLRLLFERFPDLGLAGGGVRRRTRVLRGWERLPVRTGPAPLPLQPVPLG